MRRLPAWLIVFLWGVAASAQQPLTDPAQSGQPPVPSEPVIKPSTDEPEDRIRKDERQRPPTPLEERTTQIRRFNPLGGDEDAEKKAAEKEKEKEEQETQKRREGDRKPLPGSVAASDAHAVATGGSGPQVVEDADAQQAQFAGPAVLSHDFTINSSMIPDDLQWKTFANVSAVYDTGVNAAATGPQGPVQSPSSFGMNFSWGISGRHKFHRDSAGFMYTGNRPWYTQGDQFSGMNSRLALDYSHIVSSRLSLKFAGTANIFSHSYSLENSVPTPDTSLANIADVNIAASTVPQVFDTGSRSYSMGLSATWKTSPRLSYAGTGNYFVTTYGSQGLIGVAGVTAQGTVNYRVTETVTTGLFYSFSTFGYPEGAGRSYSNSVGGLFSYAISRATRLSLRLGEAFTQMSGLETVPLSPEVAALFGIPSEIIEARTKSVTQDISGQMSKDFGRRATLSATYAKGISPGNGLYLTSTSQTMALASTFRITSKIPITISVGRSSVAAAGLTAGAYTTEFVRIGTSRPINNNMSATFSADYRHFLVGVAPGLDNQISVNCGFSWNHADEKLWPPW